MGRTAVLVRGSRGAQEQQLRDTEAQNVLHDRCAGRQRNIEATGDQGVDLAELARASLARLRAAEPARKVELVVPDRLPVRLDVNLAQTLVDNLVGNAWKFTAHTSEPRIEVSDLVVRYGGVVAVGGAVYEPPCS